MNRIADYETARRARIGGQQQSGVHYPRVLLSMQWDCGHGHVHETYAAAEACIARATRARLTDPYDTPARYTVHEAGDVQPDGSQCCRRCGFVILDPPLGPVDRTLWGFPSGRRIIVGPTCTFLVTADRPLAADERHCR